MANEFEVSFAQSDNFQVTFDNNDFNANFTVEAFDVSFTQDNFTVSFSEQGKPNALNTQF